MNFEIPNTSDWAWVREGIEQYAWLNDIKVSVKEISPHKLPVPARKSATIAASRKHYSNTVPIGGMDLMLRAFWRMGFEPPYIDYPGLGTTEWEIRGDFGTAHYAMNPYQRQIEQMSVAELFLKLDRESYAGESMYGPVYHAPKNYFVKPVKTKLFPAVFTKDNPSFNSGHWREKVWVSETMPTPKSEWRVYVRRGEIVGCCHYSGESLVFPNAEFVQWVVECFKTLAMPVCYALDVMGSDRSWGLGGNSVDWVVEVNDFWALGNYGLDPQTYVQCCVMRWREIMRLGLNVPGDTLKMYI